jgi:hypothetical protein
MRILHNIHVFARRMRRSREDVVARNLKWRGSTFRRRIELRLDWQQQRRFEARRAMADTKSPAKLLLDRFQVLGRWFGDRREGRSVKARKPEKAVGKRPHQD